jgi:mycofactocin precursor
MAHEEPAPPPGARSSETRKETKVSKAQREEKDVVETYRASGSERAPEASPERTDEPLVVEEICVEELAIDGICGVY